MLPTTDPLDLKTQSERIEKKYSIQMELKREPEQQYLDKVDFKIKTVIRDREKHHIIRDQSKRKM